MISIDTTVMRDLVAVTKSANEAISNATDLLDRISTHNDWACKEKNAINDYTITNRKQIHTIQEDFAAFLNAISAATAEIEDSENSIADMFSSVESLLANILSIAPTIISGPAHTGTPAPGAPQPLLSVIKDCGPLKDVFRNLIAPVPICKFTDIDLG